MGREYDLAERARVDAVMALPNSVFVFGSNRGGIHGRGAARDAVHRYGAEIGVGEGLAGRSYAIPTKAHWRETTGLPLPEIRRGVETFLALARAAPLTFFAVTRIGCGLAGYDDVEIAPMFYDAPQNCVLPTGWPQRCWEAGAAI